MARIAGVDLPRDKRGEIALQYIYGIGIPSARKIFADARVDPGQARQGLDATRRPARVRDIIEREYKVEGDLRREVSMSVKRLMDIGSYRGIRHRKGLPVRGQRTHTNARTRKGKSKGVMVKKKPVAAAPAPPPPKEVRSRRWPTPQSRSRTSKAAAAPRKGGRKRERKEVRVGIAHVQATFNNTIVTLTDKMGNVVSWASAGSVGLQGLAQEHAVRRADRGRERGAQGDGARA